MNPVYSDLELLDRVQADMKTTMSFLKARVLAQYSDLQSIRRVSVLSEEIAKDFDDYTDTLIDEVVTFVRKKVEAEMEALTTVKQAAE